MIREHIESALGLAGLTIITAVVASGGSIVPYLRSLLP